MCVSLSSSVNLHVSPSLSAPHGLEFSLVSLRTRHYSLPTLVTPVVDQHGTMHSSGLFVSGLHLWSKVVWE